MDNCVVIDTNVFIKFCTEEDPPYLDCLSIIGLLHTGILKLAIDKKGEILKEYETNLKRNCRFKSARILMKFFTKEKYKAFGSSNIVSFDSIKFNIVKPLIDSNFHIKDIKFVLIAPNTKLKTIISTDKKSFLNEHYISWLKKELDINAIHPKDLNRFVPDKILNT